jgi:hypothetical protein
MTNFLSYARGPHQGGESKFGKERVVSIRWTSVLSADRMRPLRHSDLTMSMSTGLWDRATTRHHRHHPPPQFRGLRMECSESFYSVRIRPRQRLSSLSMISANPATIRFACLSGDSRTFGKRLFRISHDGHDMMDRFRFARHRLGAPDNYLKRAAARIFNRMSWDRRCP